MGQYEVLGLLEKNKGKRFTSTQIAKILNSSMVSVQSNLIKLKKYNLVQYHKSMYNRCIEYWISE